VKSICRAGAARQETADCSGYGPPSLSRWVLMLSFAVGLAWYGSALVARIAAQDAGEAVEEEALEDTGAAAASPAPAGTSPKRAADDKTPEKRTLFQTVWEGGVVGLLILLLSFVAVAYIIEHSMSIRKSALMPDRVLDDLDELIADGKIDDAMAYCESDGGKSLVSSVILAGLTRYKTAQFGFAEYKSAVEEAGEEQTSRLYRKTEVLSLIGAIAPMLGLTGTVLGMIKAFNTIATKGGMARPDELAGGIGQALVTTLMGLVVAIPAMIACSYFRNKIDSIVSEAGNRIERVMLPLGRQSK